MTQSGPVSLNLEWTPNPNTIKYVVSRLLLPHGTGAVHFKDSQSATKAPLARVLFDIKGVTGVMLGANFVTIAKGGEADWEEVHNLASEALKTFLESGQSILGESKPEEAQVSSGSDDEVLIRRILDQEIRPAVAMDGGDISFYKYEGGVLFVHMKGSCSGCPSSTQTLRMGIEGRIREEVPGLIEVVAV